MVRRVIAKIVLFSVFAASAMAYADTFEYSLSAEQYSQNIGFDYDSPTLLTVSTDFTPDSCDVPNYAQYCNGANYDPTTGNFSIFYASMFGEISANGSVGEPTLAPGTYSNNSPTPDGTVTLVITDIPSAVTPEPAGLVLLGTGMLGAVGIGWRRYFQKTSIRTWAA